MARTDQLMSNSLSLSFCLQSWLDPILFRSAVRLKRLSRPAMRLTNYMSRCSAVTTNRSGRVPSATVCTPGSSSSANYSNRFLSYHYTLQWCRRSTRFYSSSLAIYRFSSDLLRYLRNLTCEILLYCLTCIAINRPRPGNYIVYVHDDVFSIDIYSYKHHVDNHLTLVS